MDKISLAPGDRAEVGIERPANQGVFVARHLGQVIFVPGVIPGESVIVEITEAQKGFLRAKPIEVVTASPKRVDHFWPEAAWRNGEPGVGGAEYSHIAIDEQLVVKSQLLQENLTRFAKLSEAEATVPIGSLPGETGWHYRTRARLAVTADGRLGQFQERSKTVIPLTQFPLLVSEMNDLNLSTLRLPGASYLELASSGTGQLQWQSDREKAGPDALVERVAGLDYRVGRGGFWQVHRAAAAQLVETVVGSSLAGLQANAYNLDLYGGVGLFGLAIAKAAGGGVNFEIVESHRDAVTDAKFNSKQLPGTKATRADSAEFVKRLSSGRSLRGALVVVDPPRSGLGLKTAGALAALKPRQLVYVACDSVSLARDLPKFFEVGYRLEGLVAFDLFPQTHHFETVANLILD